jgi:CHAD domain-containing protein
VLAEGASPAALGLNGGLVPLAAFDGRERSLTLQDDAAGLTLSVLEGVLRTVATEQPYCRLRLAGAATTVGVLADELAGEISVTVSPAGPATAALSLALGKAFVPRLGAASVDPAMSVPDAIAALAGQLAEVILRWAPQAAVSEHTEPVHQMRVAVRRLRSALAVFKRAAAGPELEAAVRELRALAAALGAARDWDVFATETLPPVFSAFGEDRRLAGLAAAATRRRATAHAALAEHLTSPTFRRLGVLLARFATLRPWQHVADPERSERLDQPLREFAARKLGRIWTKMTEAGGDIETLPPAQLHDLRKLGKRLRYTCEFFQPLYAPKPARRFQKRLAQLQEALGSVNDGVTAAQLMSALSNGADRAYAIGAVQGYLAAHAAGARERILESWTKLRREEPFWIEA